jgi:NADPH:quinone reductase-like Zn-dependent oxidoreductase
MLITRAELKKRERVLIQAAGSGIGSAAIQIAKHRGAQVITTVGSDKKIRRARELGADHVINYTKTDFAAEVKKITGGRGVEVALEHIGPAAFPQTLSCLAKRGRMVTCGATSGPAAGLDLRFLFSRQISIHGCYMGGLRELKQVLPLIEKKKLRPVVDQIFPLGQAREALQRMKNRENFGKIILSTA